MNTQEQLKTITDIENKLLDALKELAILKAAITNSKSEAEAPAHPLQVLNVLQDIGSLTLNDLYNAIGIKRKRSYIYKVKTYCRENNINTLEEFLNVTPGTFLKEPGVGLNTLNEVNKALNKLGIDWM